MGGASSGAAQATKPPVPRPWFALGDKPLWPRLLSALAPAAKPAAASSVKSLALPGQAVYEGETRGARAHGWGVLRAGEHRLEGQFADGRPNGQLRVIRQARLLYEGEVAEGVPHGYGKLHGDRAVYEGQLSDGFCHGFGVLRGGGVEYEGEFHGGRQDGRGTLKFPDGTIYIGEFRYGMRHGRGSFIRRDLGALETSWKSGMMDESAALIVRGRKIAVRVREGRICF